MEIRVLRYFLAIAREESISGAASFLHITQPTLSRQIMELEEELDTQLFIRGNRKLSLTEEGVFFRKRAQEIIDLVDKTEADFLSDNELISGKICIGSGESYVMKIIAQVAKEIQIDYPNIQYELYSGNAEDVSERLDKGLLDFGILIQPTDIKKYDFMNLPLKDQWGVLMKKDSPLAVHDVVHPYDLKDMPIIVSNQTRVSNILSDWMDKNIQDMNVVATYNLIYNASILVQEDIGYALTLDKLINTDANSDLCFRPLEPSLESNLIAVWKKYQVFSKAADLFLKRLHEKIENYPS